MIHEMINGKCQTVIQYGLRDEYEIRDTAQRRIYLNYDIDEVAMEELVYRILQYNREDAALPREERVPILVYVNSNGGNVTDGYGIIDVMMASETPVHTVNIGVCYSMGFQIFLAGCERYAMPHSTFLCHDGSVGLLDSTNKVHDYIEFETKQLQQRTMQYILSRTRITEELYQEKYRTEWYMFPEEAKEYGIVTSIVGTDCGIEKVI